MARPIKENADWFPHNGDMSNDPRMVVFLARCGNEGYGVWTRLLERLTKANHFSIAWDSFGIDLTAASFGIDTERLSVIIGHLASLRLVQIEDEVLKSHWLVEMLSPLLDKRESDQGYKREKRSSPIVATTIGVVATTTPHSIVEDSTDTVEKSKEEIKKRKSASADFSEVENGTPDENSPTAEEGEGEKAPYVAAAPPGDEPTDPEGVIRKWGAADSWKWVKKATDESGYDGAQTGVTVNDKLSLFCAHHSEDEAFQANPVEFLKKKFKGWLVNAKASPKGRKNERVTGTRPSASTPAGGGYTDEMVVAAFRSRYGNEMAEGLIQQNVAKLIQAKDETELSLWMEGFYNRIKAGSGRATARRGSETPLAAVAAMFAPTK